MGVEGNMEERDSYVEKLQKTYKTGDRFSSVNTPLFMRERYVVGTRERVKSFVYSFSKEGDCLYFRND